MCSKRAFMQRTWLTFGLFGFFIVGVFGRPTESTVEENAKISCVNDGKIVGFKNVPDQPWQVFPCQDNGIMYCLEVTITRNQRNVCMDVCCKGVLLPTPKHHSAVTTARNILQNSAANGQILKADMITRKTVIYVLLGILIVFIGAAVTYGVCRYYRRHRSSVPIQENSSIPIQETGRPGSTRTTAV